MMLERLCGNEPLKQTIAAMLAAGRLTHSLLLLGEEGTGAGFAARCIAADYLYPQGGPMAEAMVRGDCCHAVAVSGRRDSGRIETGIVREAVALRGAGSGGRYLVGQMTALRSEMANSALSAGGRAALLYRAQNMNAESANALLKILEEPPEGVLFLLTASGAAGVLPTVRSRCVSLHLCPPPVEVCANYCVAQGVAKADAAFYSRVFDGRIGAVLKTARDPARREQLEQARALAAVAARGDAYALVAALAALEKDKAAVARLLEDMAALAAASLTEPALTGLEPGAARRILRGCDAARQRMAANGNLRLLLTALAVELTGRAKEGSKP